MNDRISKWQIVILILSFYVLGFLLVETLFTLSEETLKILTIIDNIICFIFLGDFFYHLRIAENKRQFLKWGWIDFISSIPNLEIFRWGRLVRLLRILRLLRVARSLKFIITFFFRNRAQGAFVSIMLISLLVSIFGGIVILEVEDHPNANILEPEDAFWWAFVTVSTVGYGDYYPVTMLGRILAAILLIVGVGLFSASTTYFASLFLEPKNHAEISNEMLMEEIQALHKKINQLEEHLLNQNSNKS